MLNRATLELPASGPCSSLTPWSSRHSTFLPHTIRVPHGELGINTHYSRNSWRGATTTLIVTLQRKLLTAPSLSCQGIQSTCGCFLSRPYRLYSFPAVPGMQGQYRAPIVLRRPCGSQQDVGQRRCMLSGTELSFTKTQVITQFLEIELHGSPRLSTHLHR